MAVEYTQERRLPRQVATRLSNEDYAELYKACAERNVHISEMIRRLLLRWIEVANNGD